MVHGALRRPFKALAALSLRLKRWLWDRLESLLSMLYRHKNAGSFTSKTGDFFLGEPIGLAKKMGIYTM